MDLKSVCVKLETKHSYRERSHSQNFLLSSLLENGGSNSLLFS